jgi:hypothetical protein
MNRTIKTWITALLLFAALPATSSDRLVLSPEGYGAVKFGDKLAAAEKKLGQRAEPRNRESSCNFVTFKAYPGVRFMVEDGVVTRGDAKESKIQNSIGIPMGTSLAEVQRRFPTASIERHAYDPEGHYVIFKSHEGKRAVVFGEGGGKITDVRAGLEPSVEYIEGCL